MLDLIIRTSAFDLGIVDGKIAETTPVITESAKKEMDATDLIVLPGVIDPHVHFNEPGRTDWEGFTTGSKAAAAGGITTYFDMPLNSTPVTTNVEAFETKRALGEQKSFVDFALWGGLIPGNLNDLSPLADAGVIGFKAFMCDSGLPEFPAIDDASLREGMKRIASTGLRLALHAERAPDSERSIQCELDAIGFAVECAIATDCPLHIVHVSNAEGIALINQHQFDGVDITCETCPHYVVFGEPPTDTLAKCTPPIRSASEQQALWDCLVQDRIDVIGSDHSPAPASMKTGPYDQAWGGISGVQHGLPLLWTRGLVDPDHLANMMAGNAAHIFSLTGKGQLKPGFDADIVLFEPGYEEVIQPESLLYRHPHSPYTGRRLNGRVHTTLLRGHKMYEQGTVARAPAGQWIRPRRITA